MSRSSDPTAPLGGGRDAEGRAFAEIAQRVVRGGRLRRAWPLRGGVSAKIDALEIAAPGGGPRRVVVRRFEDAWKRSAADGDRTLRREAELLGWLRERGLEVPAVLLFDDSGEVLETPYLVMELVEGTTDVGSEDLEPALGEMAEFLARLHALDARAAGLPDLPALEDPVERLPPLLARERDPLPITADTARRILAALPELRRRENPPALLHGDFWPGNVLWRDGRLSAVLDWEDAARGEPLSDLACCRVELTCRYGEGAAGVFSSRYRDAASRVDWSDLPLWEVYVGVAALSSMAEWGLSAEEEARRRAVTERLVERAAGALLVAPG